MKYCLNIKNLYLPVFIHTWMIIGTRLFCLTLLLNSCIDESTINGKNTLDAYNINFGTIFDGLQDGEAGSLSDNKVKEFRILIFDISGNCKHNIYIDNIEGNIPVQLSLKAGIYDFVFIANEGSDMSLSSKLNDFSTNGKTLSDLISLNFASSAFDIGKNIPMSHIQRNVEIGNDKYIIESVEYPITTTWAVPLKRLAIRMDLHIKTTSILKQKSFTGVDIYNIPKNVPILETDISGNTLYNGGTGNYETTSRSFATSSADNGGFQQSTDGYEWILTDIILPSSLFNPDSSGEAITLKANYSDRQAELAILEAGGVLGHQAPRNTYFLVNATILPTSLEVQVKVKNWEEFLYNTHLVTKVRLNVSDVHLRVTEYSRGKVLFTSNQPEVYIEELTTNGQAVDDIFYGLVGNDAYNFHYEYDEVTEQGYGYFDLTVDRIKPLLSSEKYTRKTITLNASGVKRTIDVDMTIAPTIFAKYDYVGAFWRNDQMGERLITMRGGTYWTVEVIEGAEWIVVDKKKSLDPNLFTDNPEDAELYPVDSKQTYLSGNNNIFFRIGLTSVNPGSSPRYGLIRIVRDIQDTQYPKTVYLYIRQGEEADYLMRPEDTNSKNEWLGATGATVPRPLAGKFSPFNLTAQVYLDNLHTGGSSMGAFPKLNYQGGVFTKYPTQAGAFFTFASNSYPRVAMHPFNSYGNLGNWEANSSNSLWSELKPNHETCPPGYRRMREGADNQRYTSAPDVKVSELKQSIFLDPKSPTSNMPGNRQFGYYADGFFDRRIIEDAGGANAHLSDMAAAAKSNEIAYGGCLFYNPYNNASLFFPAAGKRLENTPSGSSGKLMYAGYEGHYWSSTPGASSAHSLDFSITFHQNFAGTGSLNRANGYSIRCVKDE